MTLEAEKEMNRRCVLNWLNDVYRDPKVAYYTHSDKQHIEFAHDALVLLKEQEPIKPIERAGFYYCGACRDAFSRPRQKFCSDCGRPVKWDDL